MPKYIKADPGPISLALSGKVDVVVATSPKGNRFLRGHPNSEKSDNLKDIG